MKSSEGFGRGGGASTQRPSSGWQGMRGAWLCVARGVSQTGFGWELLLMEDWPMACSTPGSCKALFHGFCITNPVIIPIFRHLRPREVESSLTHRTSSPVRCRQIPNAPHWSWIKQTHSGQPSHGAVIGFVFFPSPDSLGFRDRVERKVLPGKATHWLSVPGH